MLLNWDTKNVCIVSSQWHIRSTFGLILSLVGVIVIAAGYEALRAASRKYELAVEKRVDTAPSESSLPSSSPPLYDVNSIPPFLPCTTNPILLSAVSMRLRLHFKLSRRRKVPCEPRIAKHPPSRPRSRRARG